jgi:hypothetical protein
VQEVEKEVRQVRARRIGRVTTINGALPVLESTLADLIHEKRLSAPWCWHGHVIASELQMDTIGRCAIGVTFTAFSQEDYHQGIAPEVRVSFSVRGKRDRVARADRLYKRLAKETTLLEGLAEREAAPVSHPNGIYWPLPMPPRTSADWTVDAVAELVEKAFRHMASRLPLRAAQP